MKNILRENTDLQKGQSMLEVVAALAVVTIVLTALTIAVLLGLRNSEYSRKDNLATQYAQQGMEIIRNIRDARWDTFDGYTNTYCLKPDNSIGGVTCAATDYITAGTAKFMRTANFVTDGCGTGSNKVTVTVEWEDSKCPSGGFCKKASVVSCFSDIRAPTPG